MTEQFIPDPGSLQWKKAVDYEARRLEIFDEAKLLNKSRGWTPPPKPLSLYEQLEEETPEIDYIFDGLWSGNLQLNAQKKAGKTTLMMNAARSLVTRTPFLDRFAVNAESDCRVAFLNMELSKAQFNQWFLDMGLPTDARKRIVPYHGRQHGALDFGNPAILDWLKNWLREENISIAFLDPLSAFYDASQWGRGDPNASFLRWWAVFEQLVLEANLRGVWIGHHSGLSEDAANRGRGASAMMDKPDMSMTLRYEPGGDGNYTDAPSDTKRFVSVFGRDVDIEEFETDYDVTTRIYNATGGGSRVTQAGESWALKIYDAMAARLKRGAGIDLSADDLMLEVNVAPTGRQSADVRRGRRLAVHRGWLDERPAGRSKLYRLGSTVPISRGGAPLVNKATGGQTGGVD
jgi:hypothetical protein